ncbi:MAG: alpha/beta hydrolase [Gemmatimonadaceae bacterium]
MIPPFAVAACSDGNGGPTGGTPPGATPAVERIINDVSYGTNPAQRFDVLLPAGRTDSTPVVFVLHGGGFVAGSRAEFDAQSRALLAKGLAVVNVDYRLVDTTGMLSLPPLHRASAVRIAEQVADIKAAMDRVAANAADWKIRTTRWAVVGHSAGGTLALLYAYNFGGYNSDGRVTVAGNWAGVTTFDFVDETAIVGLDPRLVELYYRAIGAELINANRLAFMANSPFWLAFNGQARATINIRPEFNIVFGLPDASAAEYASFTSVLNQRGVTNKFVFVAGADHGFGQTGNWQTVVDETAKFIFAQM